jgi:hypothetical protein
MQVLTYHQMECEVHFNWWIPKDVEGDSRRVFKGTVWHTPIETEDMPKDFGNKFLFPSSIQTSCERGSYDMDRIT